MEQNQTTAPPRSNSKSHPTKNFANQKFYQRDFSNQDLSHANFMGATLAECKFNNCDLSYANMEATNCFRADFTGAKLYRTNFRDAVIAQAIMKPKDFFGCTITLVCEAFDGTQLNAVWWYSWLYLAMAMDGPVDGSEPKEKARERLVTALGAERYEALRRMFGARTI